MDYSRFTEKAEAKIARYGRDVAIVCEYGGYDPVSGQTLTETSELVVKAVLTQPKEAAIKAGMVEIGDMILLVSGASLKKAPEPATLIKIGHENWRVVAANTVMPDGTAILHKIQIRRS